MRRAMVLLVAVLAALPACSSCKKSQEPEHGFDPSTPDAQSPHVSAASSTARDAAPAPGALSSKERRDIRTRIDNTQCEQAAKHANIVRGLPETDPKGIDLLSSCLKRGNVAWDVCVLAATTPDTLKDCNVRLLLPPDEIPAR